jgi:hypothetical protein
MPTRHRLVARTLAALVLAAVITTPLFAQSDNTSVSGVVKDPSGALVPGAKVVLMDERTTFERQTRTNASGAYFFPSVPPGFYTVTVEADGFKTRRQTQNQIVPSTAASIDVTLDIGGTTETVSVVATVGAVLSDSGTLGNEVGRAQAENTPLSGRNALYLALLAPGVSGNPLNTLTFGMDGATATSVNGAPSQDTGITFDGAAGLRTRGGTYTTGSIDVDGIQEIQVLTSTYNAEYGRAASGQIRIVTRGGGKDFHGSAFENVQNTAFNANSWARNNNPSPDQYRSPAPLHFNQFGYNVNGPVYIPGKFNSDRSKLFFYFGQEFARYRLPTSASMTVPSMAMREGDFSQLLVPNNSFYRAGMAIKDPLSGVPFAGNIIPKSRLSQNGLGLLKAYPEPPTGYFQSGFNWRGEGNVVHNQHKETYSVDYNPGESHHIRFRGQTTSLDQWNPFDQGSDRTPSWRHWRPRSASVNHIWTISPTMINEALVAFSKDRVRIEVDFAKSADRTLYGINYPYVFPGTKVYDKKIPTVTMDLFTQLSGSKFPGGSSGPIYLLSDNLTKIHGNHTFKIGFFFDRSGENDYDQMTFGSNIPGGTDNQNGRFTFTANRSGAPSSGVAIANAALGLFDTYAEIGNKAYTPYRGHVYEWFAQDGWKVTSRLRLEIGVRHTITTPYFSLWRNEILFDPALYDASRRVAQDPKTGYILSGQDFNGMVIPGDGWPDSAKGRVPVADSGAYDYLFHGYPKGFANTHANFQPRLGVAYRIGRKQVLRAGGGRFMARPYVSDGVLLGGQAPFQPQVSMLNGSVDNPAGGSTGVRFPTQVYTVDRNYPITEAYNWNVTYGIALPLKTMLEVSYVGRRGLHILTWRNINQLPTGTTYANPSINPNYMRPYGGYYSIIMEDPSGASRYNALQLSWNRRFQNGLSWGLAYTYSSAYDDGTRNGTILANAYDRRAMWGPSNNNTPHILVINYIYEIPFLKGNRSLAGKLLGGWSISGVSQFQAGKPTGITTSDDFAGVAAGSGAQYWNVNGDPSLPRSQQKFSVRTADGNYWFRITNPDGKSIFTAPTNGSFASGSVRNVISQPGFQNWNLAGSKTFRMTEQQRIQFRCEAFNWINHPNWSGASTNPRAANFGMVQSKSSNRVLQLSLRYSF